MKRQISLFFMSLFLLLSLLCLTFSDVLQAYATMQKNQNYAVVEHSSELVDAASDDEVGIWDFVFEVEKFGSLLRKPSIFFDRSVYYPEVDAFWNQSASLVPVRITVIDKYIGAPFIKVKIFSSVDAKKVTLMKVAPGKFEDSVLVNCLRHFESVSDKAVFNVRYGDKIIVKYAGQIQATALVTFPKYVLDKEYVNLAPWQLFDSEGVPLVDYGWSIGVQYNPVTVSQYAFTLYYMYVTTQNSTFWKTFLVQANWLVKNAEQKGNFSVWEYKFDWPSYKLTDPWVSAMAQGEGLSVLTRAFVLTGNTSFLDVAETAMRSFEVEMNSGGVRYTDSSGVWYEEVADIGAPSSKILNGFNFALFGLYEYAFATNNSKGYELFWEGASSLSRNLYRYDTGSWSYYDLYYYSAARLDYHKLHIYQLMTLYKLTGDQTFQEYVDRFNSYIH